MVQVDLALTPLAVDFGFIHMMLACWHAECKSYGLTETSTQISKKTLGSKAMCDSFGIPAR
jgi:hypothetical protein